MIDSYVRTRLCLLAVFIVVGLVSLPSHAQIQVNIGASKDNTLYEDAGGTLSNGAGQHIFVGKTGSGLIRRALVAFNVTASIPAGSRVTGVALALNVSQTISGPDTVRIRRVLENWGEGTSVASGNEGGGAPATIGDATWIHRFFNTSLWSTMGGVSVAAPSAARIVSGLGSYTFGSTNEMVADVQQWLDNPSTNFGWMIVGEEDSLHLTKRFDSKEDTVSSVRPRLTVTYTPPVGVAEHPGLPLEYELSQNYPNPFNPSTYIKYQIPNTDNVTLKIFDLLGREVATLVNEVKKPGTYTVELDARLHSANSPPSLHSGGRAGGQGSGLASGVYFYHISAGSFAQTRKLVLMK